MSEAVNPSVMVRTPFSNEKSAISLPSSDTEAISVTSAFSAPIASSAALPTIAVLFASL